MGLDAAADVSIVAGRMLRAVRYARRLSQRELAELAQVRRETVGRIEAGSVTPRIDTMLGILAGAGFTLGLIDHRGRPLALHPERDALIDRAGRHLPAHLRPEPTPGYTHVGALWWGWHHIAWPWTDDWVPTHTYWKRPPPPPVIGKAYDDFGYRVWDDAT